MEGMRPVIRQTKTQLNAYLVEMERILRADMLAIHSPIVAGLENLIKNAVETLNPPKRKIGIILDSPGGVVEVVERIMEVIRHHYEEVYILVPGRAMSAGTVFAMARDKIYMNYFSCLGPIDPQIEKDGKLVPALAYLNEYNRIQKKADEGDLNTADYALFSKLDLGEIHQFEHALALSKELLINWLSTYKFKNLLDSEETPISDEAKREKANEVAEALSNDERWHSHSRMISRKVLTSELGLQIDELEHEDNKELSSVLNDYVVLLEDYLLRESLYYIVHTREYF